LLMSGNSGGIVGLAVGLGVGPGRACAPFRLGLAALKIPPQCLAETPLLACFLRALGTIVHGGQDKRRGSGKEGPRKGRCDAWRGPAAACAAVALMARIAACAAASLLYSHPARRCRSSVVEHSLGKGMVAIPTNVFL